MCSSDLDSLLSSAKIHGSVAEAIQLAFLEAWKESREQLLSKKLKITAFNERKDKFFEAWVKGILDLEPEFVRAGWLQEVIQRGLVKDEEIQNKVPKFVLALFESQESSAKKMVIEEKVEPWMISAMTSFGVLWNLSQVHIPVLENWSKKHEND